MTDIHFLSKHVFRKSFSLPPSFSVSRTVFLFIKSLLKNEVKTAVISAESKITNDFLEIKTKNLAN